MTFNITYAQSLDQQDELAPYRQEFEIADPNLIYLDGNSLGRLPKRTTQTMKEAVEHQWGDRLIRSWGEGWYEAPRRIGDKVGQLVGAAPGQVVIGDSTSVNLYKLVMAALQMQPDRKQILSDGLNFPSDLYIMQGGAQQAGRGAQQAGRTLKLAPDSPDPTAAILEAIDSNTALVALSLVAFKSGYLYDAERITCRAREVGALVLWDLCHAAGALPVQLDKWDADFAVGCTYKYLNGGPGAPAFLYVRRNLQTRAVSPIWGWFGDHSPFAFNLDYQPAEDIRRFMCGTPPMLSLLAVEPGVDMLLQAGMERIREKSIRQTEYLITLFDRFLAPLGFHLGSPREADRRGSHISVCHAEGYRINRALIEEMGVLPDFREPDNIRLGIAPLYTTYSEIWESIQRMAAVVSGHKYEKYPAGRLAVT